MQVYNSRRMADPEVYLKFDRVMPDLSGGETLNYGSTFNRDLFSVAAADHQYVNWTLSRVKRDSPPQFRKFATYCLLLWYRSRAGKTFPRTNDEKRYFMEQARLGNLSSEPPYVVFRPFTLVMDPDYDQDEYLTINQDVMSNMAISKSPPASHSKAPPVTRDSVRRQMLQAELTHGAPSPVPDYAAASSSQDDPMAIYNASVKSYLDSIHTEVPPSVPPHVKALAICLEGIAQCSPGQMYDLIQHPEVNLSPGARVLLSRLSECRE
jgi:hypothetical protein